MCGLLRRPAANDAPIEPLSINLPGVIASVPEARRHFRDFLASLGLSEEEQAQVALLFGEAVTNAVQHGSPHAAADRIRIDCWCEADEIRIAVADEGPGFDPPRAGAEVDPLANLEANLLATSGRGLFLMRACGEVAYEFPGHGTVCRLGYRRGCAGSAESR